MENVYTVGDEVRYALTGQYATIVDDTNADRGYYEIRICGSEVEYLVHVSELNQEKKDLGSERGPCLFLF